MLLFKNQNISDKALAVHPIVNAEFKLINKRMSELDSNRSFGPEICCVQMSFSEQANRIESKPLGPIISRGFYLPNMMVA